MAIQANYTYNADEFVTSQMYHLKFSGRRMRWLRWAFLGIMAATSTAIILTQDNINWAIVVIMGVAYIAVVVAEVMQHPKMMAKTIQKRFEQGIYKAQKVKFTINEQIITSNTDGEHHSKFAWDDIRRAVETPDGFLLYLDKHIFLWLPSKALHPSNAGDLLRGIFQSHQIEYAAVNKSE